MTQIRILNQQMVKQLLLPEETIETVEAVYRSKAEQRSVIWPMVFYEFEPGRADMDIKSGYMKELGIYGLKLVSWYGENPSRQLPALYGTTMLFDSKSGAPVGIVDAEYITGMRTGAAAAIGSKWLGKKDALHLLLVGAGHQGLFQLLTHLIAVPTITTVRICSPLSQEKEQAFAATARQRLQELLQVEGTNHSEYVARLQKINFEAAGDRAAAVAQSEIIVTATPSKSPLIKAEWVKAGTHISCVGADMSGKQELESRQFARARIFVDDRHQAISVGETELPIKQGIINEESIVGEIGEVLTGAVQGRLSDEDITIFDTTGIALQDLAVTKQVLDKAQVQGLGQVADL